MATFCTVPSTNCSKTLHSSLIFLHASSPCIYAALLHPIPEKSKMITCNFVKIEHPCCCGIMADRHPAYIECSRVKRMKSLQQNSLFPPKDRRPLSLSLPSSSVCLSIFLLPKLVVVPSSLASILSGHRHASPATPPGLFIPLRSPPPFLITSEAEHKHQEAPHLLQHQFLLVINRISMSCCGGNCGCGAGCKCTSCTG